MDNQDVVVALVLTILWVVILLKSARPKKSYLEQAEELERGDSEREAIRQHDELTAKSDAPEKELKNTGYFLVGFFMTAIAFIVGLIASIPRAIIRYIRREWDAAGKDK